MSPIVNTDVKMSKAMMHGLGLHEAFCIMSGIKSVTSEDVKAFLMMNGYKKLADTFDSKYLYQ